MFVPLLMQAEASPGELVGLELVAAPKADTESTPQVTMAKHALECTRTSRQLKRCVHTQK